ncbi:MAG: MBL fold metallo-hydrolase [Bacillota bacterium]
MKLQFLGAAGTVTGSRFLVSNGRRVLVDCGLFQGYKALRLRNWAPFPIEPASIDAVILTHAHIDHSGYLPLLVRNGFTGRIHCSESTRDLARILLLDSAHLQEEEAEHANRMGYSKHSPALPLYTRADAERALERFAPVPFDREWDPVSGMRARLSPAGHILGASLVTLSAGGRTVAFSGDLGRPADLIMRPPATIERADALILEATYGDRLHDAGDPVEALGRIVARTAERGGTVVIPAFAVGRVQSLLYALYLLKAAGSIPRTLPIYLDSPMAVDVTEIYLRHRAEHRLSHGECEAMCRAASFTEGPTDSRRLDESTWPMVIIAGSGMATGGRVLHHLERFGPEARNTILFAGFQAPGTRGDALVHGAREVKIHGQHVRIDAEVASLEAFSAHADHAEMLGWLQRLPAPPARTYLVHAEPAAADAMRRRIEERLGWPCAVAEYRDVVEL